MSDSLETATEYRCPNAGYAISRAVHLGRLARFYPGCRTCRHRHDTGSLSPRQVKRLRETEHRGELAALFQAEEVGRAALGQLAPATVHDVAAAMGICLRRGLFDTLNEFAPTGTVLDTNPSASEPRESVVVVAGDGRPAVAELVAAACEGLRWAGCHVVDLGAASAACLMFAADHLNTAGGLLVGNGQGGRHQVGLKLFGAAGMPLSADCGLDVVQQQFEQGMDRPTRCFGGLRRFQAEPPYLDLLRPHFHAIRPLRFVLDCACRPLKTYIEQLTCGLACRPLEGRTDGAGLAERVVAEEAHFGLHIDDDGERCRVVDEQGRAVEADRLLALIAARLVHVGGQPGGPVVAAHGAHWPRKAGSGHGPALHVVRSGAGRAAVAATMRRYEAVCGGTSDGRLWYGGAGVPLPDALHTLTHLLALLSRSDRPFSLVLDRETPWARNGGRVSSDRD